MAAAGHRDVLSSLTWILAALLLVSGAAAQSCELPPHPRHGRHEPSPGEDCPVDLSFSRACRSVPGTLVTERWTLVTRCDPGFSRQAAGNITSVCKRGRWTPPIPSCVGQCPQLASDSARAQCEYEGAMVDCEGPVPPLTTATPRCRPGYTPDPGLATAGVYNAKIVCNDDGQWSKDLPDCKPSCGISSRGARGSAPRTRDPNILEEFPWHAGVYRRVSGDPAQFKYSCGGSLVTVRHVLTVSTCVVSSQEEEPLSPEDVRVALAKKHRSWSQRDRYQVVRNVSMISVHPDYRGSSAELRSDMALLLLDDFVEVTSVVMPVCMYLNLTYSPATSDTGYMVVWDKGQTEETSREPVLSPLSLSSHEACAQKLQPQRVPLPVDKFCGLRTQGPNLDKLDNGAGLTSVIYGLHHLLGLKSAKFNNFVMITNITWRTHGEWIQQQLQTMTRTKTLS